MEKDTQYKIHWDSKTQQQNILSSKTGKELKSYFSKEDTNAPQAHKDAQHHWSEKCKSKLQWGTTSYCITMAVFRRTKK